MDRFIVGTGRCGSTLLSRMLNESPEVASIFEFFNGLDMTRRFTDEPAAGPEFAELISQEHPFVTMVLARGYPVPEIVYPFGPDSRYQRHQGLPWLLVAVVPRLSPEPDALFDEILAFARKLPAQHLSLQYRTLFEWLARRLGKRAWIERSGSSIDYLESLRVFYPEARFLHLHRDGREAALSMREHNAYRLAITLMVEQLGGETRSNRELGAFDPSAEPRPGDAISRLLEARPDPVYFGNYWSRQIENGFDAVARLEPGRYAEVSFEALLARPEEQLRRICDFFELEAGPWLADAAALIHGAPAARFPELPRDERERLDAACRPGMERLGR